MRGAAAPTPSLRMAGKLHMGGRSAVSACIAICDGGARKDARQHPAHPAAHIWEGGEGRGRQAHGCPVVLPSTSVAGLNQNRLGAVRTLPNRATGGTSRQAQRYIWSFFSLILIGQQAHGGRLSRMNLVAGVVEAFSVAQRRFVEAVIIFGGGYRQMQAVGRHLILLHRRCMDWRHTLCRAVVVAVVPHARSRWSKTIGAFLPLAHHRKD